MGLHASVPVPLFAGRAEAIAVLNVYSHDPFAMAPLIAGICSVHDHPGAESIDGRQLPGLDAGGRELVARPQLRATVRLAIELSSSSEPTTAAVRTTRTRACAFAPGDAGTDLADAGDGAAQPRHLTPRNHHSARSARYLGGGGMRPREVTRHLSQRFAGGPETRHRLASFFAVGPDHSEALAGLTNGLVHVLCDFVQRTDQAGGVSRRRQGGRSRPRLGRAIEISDQVARLVSGKTDGFRSDPLVAQSGDGGGQRAISAHRSPSVAMAASPRRREGPAASYGSACR
jgi:hypothetical protein